MILGVIIDYGKELKMGIYNGMLKVGRMDQLLDGKTMMSPGSRKIKLCRGSVNINSKLLCESQLQGVCRAQ